MKNLLGKLKGMSYKQIAVEHGEKGILGLIGLMVLIFLAGTSWSRYDKMPEEFLKKVDEGKAAIQASAWTEDRAKDYKPAPVREAVQQLHSPLEVSRYQYSTHWFWPMYPQQERCKEPKWLTPLEPIVDSGKVIIVELPQQDQPQNLMAGKIDTAEEAKTAEDGDAPRRTVDGDGPRGVPGGANSAPGASPKFGIGMNMADSSGGMQGATGPTINSRGIRFAAVRAVFPLKDQIDKLVEAMHETTANAAKLVIFVDFELERQVAVPGNKPWSGPWEKVDLQAALDVLEHVDFDTELVDLGFTDPVFTMPLPRSVTAHKWIKYASHPKIKQLNEEVAEAQQHLLEMMVEKAEKEKVEDKTRRRGLTGIQHDGRGLRNQMSGSMPDMAKQVQNQFGSGKATMYTGGLDAGAGARMGETVNYMGGEMQKDLRLAKYLLFRYFDFNVNPGNAYRYRVRLVLLNPNFKRPVEELVDESVAAGENRITPWSEPTVPTYFPEEQKVFLTKADKARPDTGLPSATLDIIQWFTDSGMHIAAKLEKLQLGQFIGGRPKIKVLRPGAESFKEEDVSIFTGSILADIASAPELDPVEHADLKVNPKLLKQLGVDKALLVDRFGQLVALDPKASADEMAAAQKTVANEHKTWEFLEKSATATTAGSDLDRLSGRRSSAGSESSMPEGMMSSMMSGPSSPLKKGGAKSKSAAPKARGKPAGNP